MPKLKRKPVEDLRVSLNCLVRPKTKEFLTGIQNLTRESQGAIIDRIVAAEHESVSTSPRARKPSRREVEAAKRARADAAAQAVERDDIDYSDVESTPGVSVAGLRGSMEAASTATREALDQWRASRKPLLKPKDQ